MLESLPNSPVTPDTVESLAESDSINDSAVLCGMRWGEELVIQFTLQFDSETHVLQFAAPDDDEHEGWFELATIDETGMDGLAEASQIGSDYIENYDSASFLEDYYGVEMEGGEVIESETEVTVE